MKTMPVSEFKAKCIATLKQIHLSHESLVVTLRGKSIVKVESVGETSGRKRVGTLKGKMVIHGDLVQLDTSEDWEMLK